MNKIKSFVYAIKILWQSSKVYFLLTFLLSIILSIPDIISLYIWKKILDLIYTSFTENIIEYKVIILYISIHFLLQISENILNKISQYINNIYSLIVDRFIINETIAAIELMQLSDLENSKTHNTINKANIESSGKIMGLLSSLVELIQNVTIFLGMSGILLLFNYKVFLIIFFSILPMAIYNQKYLNKIFDIYDKRYEKIRYNNEIKGIISKSEVFKEIKIFNSMSYFKHKINSTLDEIIIEDKQIKKKLIKQGTVSQAIQLVFTYLLKAIIILTGVVTKDSIGSINMNIESSSRLQSSLSNLIFIFLAMYENCLYLNSFSELLEYKKEIISLKEKDNRLISNFNIESIELVDIWFKYNDQDKYIIKNFSIKFLVNNTYAIVGYNGSGKTTLVKIIIGLYTPQKGDILINGISIKKYDMNKYYEQISAVFQDFIKYPLTVRENIGIGNIDEIENLDKIKKIAKESYSNKFIEDLPNQYEEKLTRGWENSTDLSIGQWQRIAIARANMRSSKIIIFDEPSAALDSKTESQILNKAMNVEKGKIVFIITHRFLNIKKANEIIVLKEGVLESKGKHSELLVNSETYHELYNAQKEMI